ncbi:MAG: hypothetical protein ACP5VC_17620 [Bryobacteraceae bacterium]
MRWRKRDLLLVLPALALMAWLDWNGMRAWFHQDDFAWLALARGVDSAERLWRALVEPAAQGTVRIWSERLFFVLLERLFGLDHRPFHLVVAATQAANLVLLGWITLRVSGSRLAAAAAPLFWAVSPALATPLAWLSAYNQILCAFFLLAAFACLLEWLKTRQRAWYAAQAGLFVLGLGALEIMVVYPALAAAWCWLERRRVPRAVWWLWLPSLLFAAVHLLWIPKPSSGVYGRHWDVSMVTTYFQYWTLALAAEPATGPAVLRWLPRAYAGALMAGAASVWLLVAAATRRVLPVFGWVWFTVTLAPVLPLRDHVSDYYLVSPAIGLAWLLATGLDAARRHGPALLAAAAVVCGLYGVYAGSAHRQMADWRFTRGREARHFVLALERATQLHPGRLLVVTGISDELFWAALFDSRLLFRERICLDPREADRVRVPAGYDPIAPVVCEPAEVADAAAHGSLVAYVWEAPYRRLRAITRLYLHRLPDEWRALPPVHLDLASARAGPWLLRGWYEAEPGGRWTGPMATAVLAAPRASGRRLLVAGMRPGSLLSTPAEVRVRLDGHEVGRAVLDRQRPSFHLLLPLPAVPQAAREMRVELSVHPVARAPGDARELGVFVTRLGLE